MHIDKLRANVSTTLARMEAETGKSAGGPTGLCHAVVVGSLRPEAQLDFATHDQMDSEEQVRLEQTSGLFRARLSALGGDFLRGTTREFLGDIVTRCTVQYDAVMIAGYTQSHGLVGGHGLAVVKVEGGDTDLAIVDSLAPGALVECDLDAAAEHIDQRFRHDQPSQWYLLLQQDIAQPLEEGERPIDVDPIGFISARVLALR